MMPRAVWDASPGIRRKVHPSCIVCSPDNENGFRLAFVMAGDGSVETHFGCETRWTRTVHPRLAAISRNDPTPTCYRNRR